MADHVFNVVKLNLHISKGLDLGCKCFIDDFRQGKNARESSSLNGNDLLNKFLEIVFTELRLALFGNTGTLGVTKDLIVRDVLHTDAFAKILSEPPAVSNVLFLIFFK